VKMVLTGGCKCGAITAELSSTAVADPSALPVRTCGCQFCVAHAPRYTSDPAGGHLVIRAPASVLVREQHGLRLADFLCCKQCGHFVAAFEPDDASVAAAAAGARGTATTGPVTTTGRAVLNLNSLQRASEFTAVSTQFTGYNSEDVAQRKARRAKAWTPTTLVVS
jgi:hypothetical protein